MNIQCIQGTEFVLLLAFSLNATCKVRGLGDNTLASIIKMYAIWIEPYPISHSEAGDSLTVVSVMMPKMRMHITDTRSHPIN